MDTKKTGSGSKVCFVEAGSPVTLREFSNKNVFPSVLKVYEGNSSLSHSFSFGSDLGHIRIGPVTIPVGVDRLFVALRKKSARVARCKDLSNKRTYIVPIDTESASDIEVSPVQDPEWRRGGRDEKLQKIAQSKSSPKVMRARSSLNTSKGESVPAGSLVFPQKVKKSKRKSVLVAKQGDGSSVEINADGIGTFSVDSADTQMSLSLAVSCLKLPFACTMKVLSDDSSFHVSVEEVKTSEVLVSIMKMTEGSIEHEISCRQMEYEVPVNLDLKVTHMVPKEIDINTQHRMSTKLPLPDETQYVNVIAIQRPPTSNSSDSENDVDVNQTLSTTKTKITTAWSQSPTPSNLYDRQPKVAHDRASNQDLKGKENTCHSVDGDEENLNGSADEENSYESIDDENSYETVDLDEDSYVSYESEGEFSGEEYNVVRKKERKVVKEPVISQKCDNIQYLQSLDLITLLQLLDAMNLAMYKPTLEERKIDGMAFSTYTQDTLQELGVENSLHRLRLMNVISGKTCIGNILKGAHVQSTAQSPDAHTRTSQQPHASEEVHGIPNQASHVESGNVTSKSRPVPPSVSDPEVNDVPQGTQMDIAHSTYDPGVYNVPRGTPKSTSPTQNDPDIYDVPTGNPTCIASDPDVYDVPTGSPTCIASDPDVYDVPTGSPTCIASDPDVYDVPRSSQVQSVPSTASSRIDQNISPVADLQSIPDHTECRGKLLTSNKRETISCNTHTSSPSSRHGTKVGSLISAFDNMSNDGGFNRS